VSDYGYLKLNLFLALTLLALLLLMLAQTVTAVSSQSGVSSGSKLPKNGDPGRVGVVGIYSALLWIDANADAISAGMFIVPVCTCDRN
jgi:hypothetical protein